MTLTEWAMLISGTCLGIGIGLFAAVKILFWMLERRPTDYE